MAAAAPFRWLHAAHVLHVFNALAVPLVVERRKMMRRALPLFINVSVTTLAGLRLQKITRRNVFAIGGLRGTGEKLPVRAVAFLIHGSRRKRRILHSIRVLPQIRACVPTAPRD